MVKFYPCSVSLTNADVTSRLIQLLLEEARPIAVSEKSTMHSDGWFFNTGNECVIRLLTPLGMRYEDSYVRAYPFDKLVEEMLRPGMVLETVEIVKGAIEKGVLVNLIINNRAGGNAPLIAREIATKLLGRPKSTSPHQMNLWNL